MTRLRILLALLRASVSTECARRLTILRLRLSLAQAGEEIEQLRRERDAALATIEREVVGVDVDGAP